MPKAIDSRNDTFITDQGSIRLSRRRARRGPRAGRRSLVRRGVAAAGADTGVMGTAARAVCSRAAGAVGATGAAWA